MHSLKTSLTISPVKRAYRHKLSNCRQTGSYPSRATLRESLNWRNFPWVLKKSLSRTAFHVRAVPSPGFLFPFD